jgi:pimeloyl-ACP methyl ester carboxylesterase
MKHFTFCFMLAFFLLRLEINAQEPVQPDGRFASVKGIKIYYEDTGKGTPLIFLHGFTGTNSMWKPLLPAFSKLYRIINIDLPGHGRSDAMDTTEVYLHKKAAEYILTFLHQLNVDSVYLLGGSSGGIISLHIATMDTVMVKKIIVIAGQTHFSTQTRQVITSFGSGAENPERLEASIKMHGKTKGLLVQRQFWNFRKLYGDPSFTPDVLSTITANALIIHGDNDPIAPVSNAFDMFKHIRKANLWIVPNGGHGFLFDPLNHADFVRRVSDFLQGVWDK